MYKNIRIKTTKYAINVLSDSIHKLQCKFPIRRQMNYDCGFPAKYVLHKE